MRSSPSKLPRAGGLLALALLAGLSGWPASAQSDLPSLEAGLSALYAEIRPAVVSIVSHRGRLAGDPSGARIVAYRRLVATGVIVDEAGSIVTTDQVAQPGDSLIAYLPDGRRARAAYIGGNPAIHVALLQLQGPRPFPALHQWSEWGSLLPEWMATVAYGPWQGPAPGNPALALSHREAVQTTRVPCGDSLAAVWRIRAPFHPGNSGGALVSLDGQWLGLITGALASTERPAGDGLNAGTWDTGLVVPAATVMRAVREIRSSREPAPRFGYLGVSTYRPGQVQRDSLQGGFGVIVSQVLRGSPADQAGVIPGDIILRYGGRSVGEVMQLTRMVAETPPGAVVPMDIQRDGVAREMRVRIGDRTAQESTIARQSRENSQRNALLREIQRYEARIAQLRKELMRLDTVPRTDRADSSRPGTSG